MIFQLIKRQRPKQAKTDWQKGTLLLQVMGKKLDRLFDKHFDEFAMFGT